MSQESIENKSDSFAAQAASPGAVATPNATSGHAGTPAAAGYSGQASTVADNHAAGGRLPWARTTASTDEGFSLNWLLVNWRASGLIFTGLLAGLTLVGGAAVGLRRLC